MPWVMTDIYKIILVHIIGTVLVIVSIAIFIYTLRRYGKKSILRRLVNMALVLLMGAIVVATLFASGYAPTNIRHEVLWAAKANILIIVGLISLVISLGIYWGVKKYADKEFKQLHLNKQEEIPK
jgi:amino acid transporter